MAGNHNSGRKPNTDAAQRARNTLAQMTQASLRAIKAAIQVGDVSTARWQQEMLLGKPHQRLEHAGDPENPVLVDLAGLSSEVLERIADMGRQIEALIAQASQNKNPSV